MTRNSSVSIDFEEGVARPYSKWENRTYDIECGFEKVTPSNRMEIVASMSEIRVLIFKN